MNAKSQFLFWAGVFLLTALFIFVFRSMLTPFVAGIVIAYLLNPLVERLERRNISRLLATLLILFLFFLIALALLILITPPLYRELVELAENIPSYIDALW